MSHQFFFFFFFLKKKNKQNNLKITLLIILKKKKKKKGGRVRSLASMKFCLPKELIICYLFFLSLCYVVIIVHCKGYNCNIRMGYS
jgi:hypothetical protein